jgi:hypothetical protein
MRCFLPAAISALSLRSAEEAAARRGDLSKVDPNGYNIVGCFDTSSVLNRVEYEGARPVTPESCYTFCADQAGAQSPLTKAVDSLQYFGIEGDTSGSRTRKCWCAVGYQGPKVDGCGPCPKDPKDGELCGGEGKASVFLLHHCARGMQEEAAVKAEETLKEVAEEQASRKLFNVLREGKACGKVHNVAVNGATTLVGSLDECKLACGSEKRCGMFTYDASVSKCLFADDTSNDGKSDSGLTCYGKTFGKGPVTARELIGPDSELPPEVKEEQQKVLEPFAGKFEKEPSCPETCMGGQANIRAKMCENPACMTCAPNLREANCKPLKCPETCLGEAGGVKMKSCDDYFCKIPACEDKRTECNKGFMR